MSKVYRAFAFVSGKGGVGKTLLAANFAYCSSTVKKTLLIDLDFQNQGASGLLSQYLRAGCTNASDIITGGTAELVDFVKVREDLYFVPAFDPGKTTRFGSQTFSASLQISSLAGLAGTFDRLAHQGDFETIVLDCHGGLDDVSFAAFI